MVLFWRAGTGLQERTEKDYPENEERQRALVL